MESRLTLFNQDLLYFHRGFGPRFGPLQRVEIIFCSDRSGPAWQNEETNGQGFLKSHSFIDGSRADATAYVFANIPSSGRRSARIALSSIAIADPKEDLLRGLVHELIHVQQAWLHDPHFDSVYPAKGSYRSNVFEQQAYREA